MDGRQTQYTITVHTPNPHPRSYFASFSNKEVQEQIDQHPSLNLRSRAQLETTVTTHAPWFNRFKYAFRISIGLNLGFIAFIATTGVNGINNILRVFNSSASAPDDVGKGIGIPLGVIDILFYMLVFSAAKQATIATLDFLVWRQKSLAQHFCEWLHFAYRMPKKAFGSLLFFSLLFFFNSACMSTVLLGFVSYLSPLSYGLLSIFVLSFGWLYMSQYSNAEAREGLLFWQNKQLPWVIAEVLCHGKIAMGLQMLLESTASPLSAYPTFYYIGYQMAKAYGLSNETAQVIGGITCGFTFIRGALVLYPMTYHYYLQPEQELKKLQAESKPPDVIPPEPAKTTWQLLRDEPIGIIKFLFRATVSIVLTLLTLTHPTPTHSIVLSLCWLFSFAGLKAHINHSKTIHTCNHLKATQQPPEEKKNDLVAVNPPSGRMKKLLQGLAFLFAVDSAASDLMILMGALLIDDSALKLFLLILAFDRLIVIVNFNLKKVTETLTSFFQPKKEVAVSSHSLFIPTRKANTQPAATYAWTANSI